MKNLLKSSILLFVIAVSFSACDPAKKPVGGVDSLKTDSLKKDSTLKTDTAKTDTAKKDTAKKV